MKALVGIVCLFVCSVSYAGQPAKHYRCPDVNVHHHQRHISHQTYVHNWHHHWLRRNHVRHVQVHHGVPCANGVIPWKRCVPKCVPKRVFRPRYRVPRAYPDLNCNFHHVTCKTSWHLPTFYLFNTPIVGDGCGDNRGPLEWFDRRFVDWLPQIRW